MAEAVRKVLRIDAQLDFRPGARGGIGGTGGNGHLVSQLFRFSRQRAHEQKKPETRRPRFLVLSPPFAHHAR